MKPTQRKAVAAEIRAHIATSPARPPQNTWGGFLPDDADVRVTFAGKTRVRIRNHPDTLEAVARTIERGGNGWRNPASTAAMETDVLKMDAVRLYGTPAAALEVIRRQLAAQGESMDPADVRHCERAASLIENHIEAEALKAEQEAAEDALEARIAAGRVPDNLEVLTPGTEVCVVSNYRRYIGTVTGCKVAPHPILGEGQPTAVCTVSVTRLKETKGKRYAFHPVRPHTLNRVIWKDIIVIELEPAAA